MSTTPHWLSHRPSPCLSHVSLYFTPGLALPSQFPSGLKRRHAFEVSMADYVVRVGMRPFLLSASWGRGRNSAFFMIVPLILMHRYLLFFGFILLCYFLSLSLSHISKAICLVHCKKNNLKVVCVINYHSCWASNANETSLTL